MTTAGGSLIGRSRTEGQQLIRAWYQELHEAAESGDRTAYVFVMGSLAEILRNFDFHLCFPEINALQTAVRKVSMHYLNIAEDYGYSPDVCSYVKADVGVHLSEMQHPMGLQPKPALVIATNMCNTYVKWAEIWERIYGAPVCTFDIPGMRYDGFTPGPGNRHFEPDRAYVRHQIDEVIATCERITGRKLDLDRLRADMERVNRMSVAYRDLLRLNQSAPAPFNAMSDGLAYMGLANAYRGTEAGVKFMELARDEMAEKVKTGVGSLKKERFRLLFIGTFCYVAFRRFIEMFEEWGGVFVNSEYLAFASGGLDHGAQYDLDRPLDSLAEQLLIAGQRRMSKTFFSHDEIADIVRDWKCDGIIFHSVKSCRTISTVLADTREYVLHKYGIPSLALESDLLDARCWSEAQVKNRVDAFFESLESHRASAAAGR